MITCCNIFAYFLNRADPEEGPCARKDEASCKLYEWQPSYSACGPCRLSRNNSTAWMKKIYHFVQGHGSRTISRPIGIMTLLWERILSYNSRRKTAITSLVSSSLWLLSLPLSLTPLSHPHPSYCSLTVVVYCSSKPFLSPSVPSCLRHAARPLKENSDVFVLSFVIQPTVSWFFDHLWPLEFLTTCVW